MSNFSIFVIWRNMNFSASVSIRRWMKIWLALTTAPQCWRGRWRGRMGAGGLEGGFCCVAENPSAASCYEINLLFMAFSCFRPHQSTHVICYCNISIPLLFWSYKQEDLFTMAFVWVDLRSKYGSVIIGNNFPIFFSWRGIFLFSY